MPTREEKVAQLEAALRKRFFPNVPRIEGANRAGWLDEQHDLDRLSRSLAAYALVGEAGLDDTTAAGSITDGENDCGIDALHFDRTNNRLLIVQAKFKRDGAAPSQAEGLKTKQGIERLRNRDFAAFNSHFHMRRDEIEEALDTGGIVIELVLIYLGDGSSPHVDADFDAFKAQLDGLTEQFRWHNATVTRVHGWLIEEQAPASATAIITLENFGEVLAPRKAVYGQMSVADLAQLVEAHGKALFERNIRHYLGSVGVNSAIADTVRRKPQDFFYLNNGITAVAEKIEPAAPANKRCRYTLTNVSIVNGAQTAGSVAGAAMAGQLSADAKVLVTIIELGPQSDDLGLRITRARNHQTAVRGVDFAALDPNQERLRQELQAVGLTYHYRPSAEARVRHVDACTLEEAAVAIACLSFPVLPMPANPNAPRPHPNAVDFVVTAKKEIGRLWEQGGTSYRQLFRADLSGVRLWRLVRIFRFVDDILAASERSQPMNSSSRLFYRHGRFFIMAFVGHRLTALVQRPELEISPADRITLSQQVNVLSELILQRSQPLLAVKGYLSIFRNLTDAQPLAEGVLTALAAMDAPPAPPAPAISPTPPSSGTPPPATPAS